MEINVVWLYPKLDKWMGGSKFVFECTKRIAKDFPLRVIAQKGSDEVVSKFRDEKIDVKILNTPTYTDLSFWFKFRKIIHNDIKLISEFVNPETIIISSMYPLNYVAASFPNKHIQIIYEPFSFFYRNDLYKDYGILIDLFFRLIRKKYSSPDKLATQKADIVLTLSQYEQNNIKKIYGVSSKIIYEGADLTLFYPRETKGLELKYLGKIPLMHSTGFDIYKGTDLIFEALPLLKMRLPNFQLFITYTRKNKQKLNAYYKIIKKNKLEENVKFLKFLPIEELPFYYSYAMVYLEPGKGRAMSLSNKEAMACGTPVIRGNDSTEEVIDGYNGYLVPTDKPKALVDAILEIVTNDELRNSMSKNSISLVKEKFSWESVVNGITKYFKDGNDYPN
jgi:glycosyltransferase involved in cell wall biosynthesis